MGVSAYNRGTQLIQKQCGTSKFSRVKEVIYQTDSYPRGEQKLFQDTYLRNDGKYWHLMNHPEKGWESFSYVYKNLKTLFSRWNIVIVGYGKDSDGFFYKVKNI